MLALLIIAYLLPFFVIQFPVGNIDTKFLAFPLGEVMGFALFAILWVLHSERGESKWIVRLRSPQLACLLLALVAVFCALGGSIPRLSDFSTTWPFVALLLALTANLFLAILHRAKNFTMKRDGAFMAVHMGLLLALFSGMAGAGETEELRVIVQRDDDTIVGADRSGLLEPLGYALRMENFEIERNPADGSPVQYRTGLLMNGRSISLSVNHPYSVNLGEDIYLTHYDMDNRYGDVRYCMLTVVRQPWKYPMLTGILLLLAGVVWYMEKLNGKVENGRHGEKQHSGKEVVE